MSDTAATESEPDVDEPVPTEPESEPSEAEAEPDAAAAMLAVQALQTELAASHTRAAAREDLILRLHEEVQRLRVGERAALLRPVIVDLGRLRNTLADQAARSPDPALAILFAGFGDDVTRTLERIGVEAIVAEPGDAIVTGTHRVTGIEPTGDTELDQTVASAEADGYRDTMADKVIAPAQVRAWRHEPRQPTTPTESTTEESNGQ